MSERSKHLFQFAAEKIAAAAEDEATYHEGRAAWWQKELDEAKEKVKTTAKLEFKEFPVTGGSRLDVSVNYGDPVAYGRMQEAHGKIDHHRKAAETFRTEARVYASQGTRSYELDAADVEHFRLGSQPRES